MLEKVSLSPLPIKQKVYLFNHPPQLPHQPSTKQKNIFSFLQDLELDGHSSSLKPRMPHLKLREQPSFIKGKGLRQLSLKSSRNSSLLSYIDPIKQTPLLSPKKDLDINRKKTLQTQKRSRPINIKLMMMLKHRRSSAVKSSRSFQEMMTAALKL